MNTTEYRISEKEAAHYFSNAAALYVLGVGFFYFSYKTSSPFTGGLCFWFSLFLLCDCLRQARVSGRLDRTQRLLATTSGEGVTHFGAWLQPETLAWKDILALRLVKGVQSESYYFEARREGRNFLRYMLFGIPKYELPVSTMPGGKEAFLETLSLYPAARHLLPERATEEVLQKAA